ncbi:hypothetical protein GGX14DRAFT_571101 [Mycena pura]|uniref:Uncharacterized protein n=1 Tax=Mycena pura TaxID=153505 RepID=A0AAD6Y8A6_9AGAR|nr:hypothetical protein GGX14DRAFT_571101 [Mycena pura]
MQHRLKSNVRHCVAFKKTRIMPTKIALIDKNAVAEKLSAESAGPFLSRAASSVLSLATRGMPVDGQLSSLQVTVLQRAPTSRSVTQVALGADDDGGLEP